MDSVMNPYQQQQRGTPRNANRPRLDERPKSANRLKDELGLQWSNHPTVHSPRPERERLLPAPKRPSTIPRRVGNEQRPLITVPITQRNIGKVMLNTKSGLPDQETIRKREDLELNREESPDNSGTNPTEKESISTRHRNLVQLKLTWQENSVKFEKMKNDLKTKQRAIMEHYASMRNTHQLLQSMGQKISLPSSEDLRIMNVARLTPEQLLQLCSKVPEDMTHRGAQLANNLQTIDMKRLYSMPAKLAATCEETLSKRKEIIDWFETIKVEGKGVQLNVLSKKLQEFSAENEMLKCSLEQAKAEFLKELNEVVEFMRKGVSETMNLQLRTEELTYELSELNSQNADLRKKIHNSDHIKSPSLKIRIEELNKELKEEKCKKGMLWSQLNRLKEQGKTTTDQLEATLEQAQSKVWTLERTVQQLHEQNEKLQTDFDKELNKLTESIRENTIHLEEIAEAREKLQLEKEDLERRLKELSENYNESLKNTKQEINTNVAKIVEAEKKYEEIVEDKKKIETQVELLCSQLLESELAKKDALKLLQEKEEELTKMNICRRELETTKRDLEKAFSEIEDYRLRFIKQSEDIKDIERNFKESVQMEKDLRSNIATKDEYIAELEKTQLLFEQHLQESESKMQCYEKQLSSLKTHIEQLKNDFGDFEDLDELHKIVNQQRVQLLEATRQNEQLGEVLRKNEKDLERHLISLREQERILEQRENIIKILSEKEEEHANIIKLLRNNLEIRAQADIDLNQQLAEKNAQISSLITNVETRKQQLSQLEKIILTLEEQKRKANAQRKKDQGIINKMEQKILEYEALQSDLKTNNEAPANLDSIIKILEDELGTPYELQVNDGEHELVSTKQKHVANHGNHDSENFQLKSEYHKKTKSNKILFQTNTPENDPLPTKIVMGNFVKKTYMPINDEHHNTTNENLDRKKAIKNTETQKWVASPENIDVQNSPALPFRGVFHGGTSLKDNLMTKNIKLLAASHLRDEKRLDKLFKLTSHKL